MEVMNFPLFFVMIVMDVVVVVAGWICQIAGCLEFIGGEEIRSKFEG